jgi:hypothetical protein
VVGIPEDPPTTRTFLPRSLLVYLIWSGIFVRLMCYGVDKCWSRVWDLQVNGMSEACKTVDQKMFT